MWNDTAELSTRVSFKMLCIRMFTQSQYITVALNLSLMSCPQTQINNIRSYSLSWLKYSLVQGSRAKAIAVVNTSMSES